MEVTALKEKKTYISHIHLIAYKKMYIKINVSEDEDHESHSHSQIGMTIIIKIRIIMYIRINNYVSHLY